MPRGKFSLSCFNKGIMESNKELDLAFKYISETSQNVFLTGKAGTGKTTFLSRVRSEVPKNMIVVAPTAVAAINASGVTIHSQFNLPLGVCGSLVRRSVEELRRMRFSKAKIALLRSIDLLVIDEISMVRCDVLDAVDEVLRRFRNHYLPFGGVQVLIIGDVQQLSPVAVPSEMEILKQKYSSIYFFDSEVFTKANFVPIELKTIYRQSDRNFISLLEKVRCGTIDTELLSQLNSCCNPYYTYDERGRIALTSHVHKANSINKRMLEQLRTEEYTYDAEVEGEFSDSASPVDRELSLKEGAQVMFAKNDSHQPMRYYNGKVGVVTAISDKSIEVTTIEGGVIIDVVKEEWSSKVYEIDAATGVTTEVVKGTFKQYPLRLAWAITIHKSQGLTFDRVAIDAADCFAHGQAYVALSRCRSFEGMLLTSQLGYNSFVSDGGVRRFAAEASDYTYTTEHIEQSVKKYRAEVVTELLSFGDISKSMSTISSLFANNLLSSYPREAEALRALAERVKDVLNPLSEQFVSVITQHIFYATPLKNGATMEERIREGVKYMKDNFIEDIQTFAVLSDVNVDNAEIKKRLKREHDELSLMINIKLSVMDVALDVFTIDEYLKEKRRAITRGLNTPRKSKRELISHISSIAYEESLCDELYETLSQWRLQLSRDVDLKAYQVLPNKALRALSDSMPTDYKELKDVHGMGKIKIAMYGEELLDIIINFKQENNL